MTRKTIVFLGLLAVAALFIFFPVRSEIVVGGGGGGSTTVVGGNISNTYNFGSQFIVANVTNVALPAVLSNITASGNAPAATNASSYVASKDGLGTNATTYNGLTNRGDLFVASNQWVTGTVTVNGLQTNKLDLRTAFTGNLISENNVYSANNLTSQTFNVVNSLQLGAATNRSAIGYVGEFSSQGGYYAAPAGGIAAGYIAMTASGFQGSYGLYDFRDPSASTFVELGSTTSLFSTNVQVNGTLTANLVLSLPVQAPSRVAVINGSSQLVSDGAVTTTELSYLDGLTEALSTSLANKVDENSGVATNLSLYNATAVIGLGTFSIAAATADRAAYFDGSKNLVSLSTVDSSELGRLDGVTSPIQTQLDNKVDELSGVATNLTARGINLPTLTASRGLIVDASGNITNITSGSPTTEFVRADGTAAVPAGGSGTPGGTTPMMQMNMGGVFVGTTNLIYDVTNSRIGLGVSAPVAGLDILSATAPTIKISTGSVSNQLDYNGVGTLSADDFALRSGSLSRWTIKGGNGQLAGGHLYLSNALALIPTAATVLNTNTFWNGTNGTVFTNVFNSVAGGLTNIYVTNIVDGQTIRGWLFPSNGVTVAFPQFAASQYTDGAIIPIATNQWTEVEITRRGSETNIHVKSATLALLVGNGLTMTTNFVTHEVTLNNTANGVYRTIYIDAAAMVSNVTAGATFLTEQTATPTNRMVDSYVFDGANSNIVQFKVALPLEWDAGVVKVKLWTWTTNNVATTTNVYGLSATAITNGIVMTNADWGAEQTITNVVSSAGGGVQLSPATIPITVLNANVAGSLVWFRLRRIPQNANDNDIGQSKVLGAWIQYKQSATEPTAW